MTLKPGVTVTGIQPETVLALVVADSCYARRGVDPTVTSITDGVHGKDSLHYSGRAADLRTRDVSAEQRELLRQEIAAALGAQYDVVLETDHIHLEFDPK